MKSIFSILRTSQISFCLMFLAFSSFASGLSDEDKVRMDKILETCKLEQQFDSLTRMVCESIKKYSYSMKEDAAAEMNKLSEESYSPKYLYPIFRKIFLEKIDPGKAGDLEKWYGSPLGKKITEYELQALAPGAAKEFQSFIPISIGLSEKRKDLVREYLKTTFAEKYSGRLIVNPIREIMLSTYLAMPEDRKMDEESFDNAVLSVENEAMVQYSALLPVSTAFTYRDISDEEFEKFLEFNRSEAGQNLNTAVWEALISTMDIAAKKTGEGIGDILKKSIKEDKKSE